MPISVVDPISPAIDTTKRILFQPFDLGKWFLLGFCAFLAQLGEGGFSGNVPNPSGGQGQGWEQARAWVEENLGLVILIAVAVTVLIVVLSLLFAWLGARGRFMFLDGVVRNRGAVVEPWREFRREGNSLFGFILLLSLGTLAAMLLAVGVGVAIAWSDITAEAFGAAALTGILVGGVLVLVISVATGVVSLFLSDFVVPIMYLRRLRVMEAWGVFRQELLAGRGGTFTLYVLFKIVIGMCLGFMMVFAVLCTCCLAAIPYLGSVILLPFSVFHRAYSLHFLEQFGPEWRFFPRRRRRPWEDEEEFEEGTDENEPPAGDAGPPEDRGLPG